MSGSSGLLCCVPASNLRCGLNFLELVNSSQSRGWSAGLYQGSVSPNSRQFLVGSGHFSLVRLANKYRPAEDGGGVRVWASQTDAEMERIRSSKMRNGSPRRPLDSSIPGLEDENGLPLLRGTSRRDPNMEVNGGYLSSSDYSARAEEIYQEDDNEDDEGLQSLLTTWRGANRFILAGMFILGIGAGITVDTVLNVEPNNVASREVIDRQTPNPDVCIANGMSAMVLDQRLFISFNPFNVYVSQTEVKPGCVLRQSNWSVLEQRGLVTSDEVRACKRNMNTFGFVGDLRQAPEISCVYHSESAENQFLKDPSKATLGDGYQPKDFNE
ncbi:uncharacterized protein [Physcomitrium patens]|uniref:DUF3172 domain-containing protein n=1 Tax=Physcomitrium patens TaxID=3218 RepID=A0A2K1K7Z8_PHYPA|nr:uncharacterized protein LOC112285851 [Physcomitrium patens]XP_024382904.1 uncharacterized protein LOC112285851 [Physcomitrium patens]PNR49899.1 hypothetical protein PHYPA_011796 [Physcomitrium patens]|eukprot:XP_024382903.1 uncharacterized protein LOC112285851 [Physcomitrella patens]